VGGGVELLKRAAPGRHRKDPALQGQHHAIGAGERSIKGARAPNTWRSLSAGLIKGVSGAACLKRLGQLGPIDHAHRARPAPTRCAQDLRR